MPQVALANWVCCNKGGAAQLFKAAELTVLLPRDAKAFEVPAGHFFRSLSVEGSQVGDPNL